MHGALRATATGALLARKADATGRLEKELPGSKAYVAEYEPPKPTQASEDIKRSLAWREGQIVLEGESLDDAVAQFNRYNTRKLVISDPSLAEEKLVGQFRATEPLTFAEAVATTLGAAVVEDGDTIRLSRGARR